MNDGEEVSFSTESLYLGEKSCRAVLSNQFFIPYLGLQPTLKLRFSGLNSCRIQLISDTRNYRFGGMKTSGRLVFWSALHRIDEKGANDATAEAFSCGLVT
jgi:hypothetical protein